MRYSESKQQSSEILRIMIPLMSGHEAACNPLTFAIWYEYLTGVNEPLRAVIQDRLARGTLLNDDDMHSLYRSYILKRDEVAQERYETGFRRVVGEVSQAVSAAQERAGDYASSLAAHGTQLQGAASAQDAGEVARAILNDTVQMRETVTALSDELQGSLKEIDELRRELDHLQVQLLTDPMTGLHNRRGLEKALAPVTTGNAGEVCGCSVMMVDIDHFKRINDTHGHLLGDRVIRMIAELLSGAVREQGSAARWGGEEFLVLLPAKPLAEAQALAERVRAAVERGRIRRGDSGERLGAVTVSIGVAYCQQPEQFETLVSRADKALYEAKKTGRNRVVCAA